MRHSTRNTPARCTRDVPRQRTGVALITVLIFMSAMAALALSSIFLASNATLIGKAFNQEREIKYAVEGALGLGKSRVDKDPSALPDTGYRLLYSNLTMRAADGVPIPRITVDIFAGPTGSTTGQFGRFASVVAVAKDLRGARALRRLELTQESFAKYAYWTDVETNNGSPIYFGGGDQLWGPVWSNDVISLMSSGASFHDVVGTAKTISGAGYGTFSKGYKENQQRIELPSTAKLAFLGSLASSGGFNFTAPNSGTEQQVGMRIEFLAADMNADGDSLDANEGFFRVYTVNPGNAWALRGDLPAGAFAGNTDNCGDWHYQVINAGTPNPHLEVKFYPASVHGTAWFRAQVESAYVRSGYTAAGANSQAVSDSGATLQAILSNQTLKGARCYPAGDPHLVASDRPLAAPYAATDVQKGGDDTTFTATGKYGAWTLRTATPDTMMARVRPFDAKYLYPLYRGLNPGTKGVIYVSGTVALSGVIRGRVTLYSKASIVLLRDLRYANDPGLGVCKDMLGLISDNDVVVADNAMNTPQDLGWGPLQLDDTPDMYIHAVIMTLNTSFRAENYANAPTNATGCNGKPNGRGCLYLTGGLIQKARGPVGTSNGSGYIKRYSYDHCAVVNPPPYFPTTGRFSDNRYYELDPLNFDAATLYKRLTPTP
jgi:hypothetical protein